MKNRLFQVLIIIGTLLAGAAQAQEEPLGPGGEITFDSLAAVAVPVNDIFAMLFLVTGLGVLGVWAIRRHSPVGQSFSIAALSAAAGAVLLATMAVPVYQAVARIPPPGNLTEVSAAGSYTFSFSPEESLSPVPTARFFVEAEFQNVSSQPLRITDLNVQGCELPIGQQQNRGEAESAECEVGAELAPNDICEVPVPESCFSQVG
jgi:hypothetical protein